MTLVELAIVLALLVAVASLALPNMFAILSRSAIEEGRRQALSALASARADALGSGLCVRVTAEPTQRGWQLRAATVLLVEQDPVVLPEAGPDLESALLASLPPQWRVLEPAQGQDSGAALAEDIEAVDVVELATFLPDGGAITPELAPTLFAAGNRRLALRVDRWTGRASLQTPVPPSALEDLEQSTGRAEMEPLP